MVKKKKSSASVLDCDEDSPGGIVVGKFDQELASFIEFIEQDMQIDEHALEEGLRKNVEMHHRVAKRVSLEVSRRDAARQWFKTVEADIDSQIRAEAKKAGEKVTEREIESRKILSKEYQRAFRKVLGIERGCKEIEALEWSLSRRQSALKHLAELWIAGYYGERIAAGQERKSKDALAANTKKKVKERRNYQDL